MSSSKTSSSSENLLKNSSVRVRFAPSPTGYPHIGNLRTALFNWLFARHNGGSFLVRIEDTDLERSRPEYTQALFDGLAWLNLSSDEPVIIQTEQLPEHQRLVADLLARGLAYKCTCTQEEVLERHKQLKGADDLFVHYDGHCRHHAIDESKPYVVRFAIPTDRTHVSFDDLVRGPLTIATDQLDDFIIVRSDGMPIYNFVVVADDILMRITHILRGEDHIINTYKQILLYEALGRTIPRFGHFPMILGASGDRLSKRDAATSVLDYRNDGYLPDALFNYLVRLGWAHGDQEVFSREELIQHFSLDDVGKKGAIFDPQKLLWLNGVYIRAADNQDLLNRLTTDVAPTLKEELSAWSDAHLLQAVALYKERVKTLREMADEMRLMAHGPREGAYEDADQWINAATADLLLEVMKTLESVDTFTVEMIAEALKKYAKEQSIKLVAIAQPIRLALLGKTTSPGVFELLAFLGKQESLERMRTFQHWVAQRR
jgi:glutamyl-tRNA synthetase